MAVTGNIGDAEVRLENAAEEATMQKILDAIKNEKSPNGTGPIAQFSKKLGPAGVAINGVTGAFNVLGKVLGGMGAVLAATTRGLSKVVQGTTKFVDSQMTVTDFTKSIKDSKLNILGLGDAVHAVTELLYKNYTTFQQLSSSGIAFGGRLEEMTRYGAAVGTSLEVVAGNLMKNTEELARLGTATRGASLALGASEIAFDLNNRRLQSFGLSFDEQNERFLSFFAQNALALQRGTISQSQIISQSDDYAMGLRRLSELTGVQADQIQEGVDKANMNKAFENFIAGMDGETANRMRSILNTAQATFGDAGREASMAMMLGVAPITEQAQMMSAITPGFDRTFRNIIGTAKNFSGSLDEFNRNQFRSLQDFANANRGFADANSKYFATLGLYGDPYGEAGSAMISGFNKVTGSFEDFESGLGKESPLQGALNSFNTAIQKVRDAIGTSLVAMFESPPFIEGLKKFELAVPKIANAIEEFIANLQSEQGRQKIIEDIKGVVKNAVHSLMLALNDTFLGYFIDDDKLKEKEREKLAGKSQEDLRKIAGDSTASKATIEVAEEFIKKHYDSVNSDFQKGVAKLQEVIAPYSGGMFPGMQPITGSFVRGYDLDEEEFFKDYDKATPEDLEKVKEALNLLAQLKQFTDKNYSKAKVKSGMEMQVQELLNSIGARRFGTLGVTGQMVEPKNTIATIEKGERVLSPEEATDYNAQQKTNLAKNSVQRVVDSARDQSVNLNNALNTLIKEMQMSNRLSRNLITAVENT